MSSQAAVRGVQQFYPAPSGKPHLLIVTDCSERLTSVRHSGISLLVEASRILNEPSLAGVLPRYRAMPCSRSDLVELAHCLLTADVRPRQKRMLL